MYTVTFVTYIARILLDKTLIALLLILQQKLIVNIIVTHMTPLSLRTYSPVTHLTLTRAPVTT